MAESWDGVAPAYDRVSRESRAHRDKIERVAELVRDSGAQHLLDIGCGSGVLEARLFADGFDGHVMAIDGSAEMVALAGSACRGHPGTVTQQDLNAPLQFADGQFDCAVAINVLFLLDAPGDVMREIRRTLRDGALFIVVMPKPEASGTWAFLREHFRGLSLIESLRETGRLIVGLPAVIATARFQSRLDAEHARTGSRYLAQDDTESLLAEAGFSVCSVSDIQAGQNWLLECLAD